MSRRESLTPDCGDTQNIPLLHRCKPPSFVQGAGHEGRRAAGVKSARWLCFAATTRHLTQLAVGRRPRGSAGKVIEEMFTEWGPVALLVSRTAAKC